MQREVWRYGAMKAILRLASDGLVMIQVSGLVTPSELKMLRRDFVIAMGLPGALAMTIDFRRASLLLSEREALEEHPSVPPSLHAMPVAVICSEVDEQLFLTHAWRQAKKGLLRAVFTEPAAASSWVLARAGGSSVWG